MTFDELLKNVEQSSMQAFVSISGPNFAMLLGRACTLFETHSLSDQMTAMACMLGMLFGTMEGEKTEAEKIMGIPITHKERMQLFEAQVMVVFRESMAARGMPVEDVTVTPEQKAFGGARGGGKNKKTARVIQLVAGTRKRKRTP